MKTRKKQTAVKGRFSAMFISAAVHVAVLIAAGTFVAVTVVQRQETRFEGKQVSRPRMQLQRLQVPQRARMERQAPQMSQRVTAQAVSTSSVEFQMPEIAGLGGGIPVDMSGAGFTGGLGFATPQINLFGLRSQAEKVVFLLDTNRAMLIDEIGGIPAYTIIKEELLVLCGRLPPTTLFNVIVFDQNSAVAFAPELVSAGAAFIDELKTWLSPLNASRSRIGIETLASPGHPIEFEPLAPVSNIQPGWMAGISFALQNGVESVYWLGAIDHMMVIHRDLYNQGKRGRPIEHLSGLPPGYEGYDFSVYPGGETRWNQLVEEARKMHEAENARRRAAGQPDRVLPMDGGPRAVVQTYFPGTPIPERKIAAAGYWYEAQDVVEYIQAMQRKYEAEVDRSSLARLRERRSFNLNVIHFVPVNAPARELDRLEGVSRQLNGQYLRISGLEAVQSAVSARE